MAPTGNVTGPVTSHPAIESDLLAPHFGITEDARAEEPVFRYVADYSDLASIPDLSTGELISIQRINSLQNINKVFLLVNRKLAYGGIFVGSVEASEEVKKGILDAYPGLIAWIYYLGLFLLKRVIPKIRFARGVYFRVFHKNNWLIPRAEVLGRLACCGYDILSYDIVGRETIFTVRKIFTPLNKASSPNGIIFKTRRIGAGGRVTYIYKFRTMHPYAEYLQSYIYEKHALNENGKFSDDFRIASWGRFLRRVWIDELPMVYNWVKGDLKLVGVRPLSEHYMSLYPRDLVEKRIGQKPGLIPPYYVDLPHGFDAIIESERRYLAAYEQHPALTDLRYLARACFNIVFKRARSS